MSIEIVHARSDEELRRAVEIGRAAFSVMLDPRDHERMLAARRSAIWYMARVDGTDAGSCGVYQFELTVPGGATVPVSGLADVGVLVSHRRCGVLSAMMARVLDGAVSDGCTAAVLWASESRIYGRFGFGPATRNRRIALNVARGALRSTVPRVAGRMVVMPPARWGHVLPEAYEASRNRRAGELTRSPEVWEGVLSVPDGSTREPRACLVHLGADGAADGYVLYTVLQVWEPTGPRHRATVSEMVAADDAVELELWNTLCQLDLLETIEGYVPVDTPLLDALEDPWALATTGEIDGLWVRLLDVQRALVARRYRIPGTVVLEVRDGTGRNTGGRFELDVGRSGVPTVRRTSEQPAVSFDVAELGSIWLGGGSAGRLARVGRAVESIPGSLDWVDAAFGCQPGPGTVHDF